MKYYSDLKKIITDENHLIYTSELAKIISGFDCWIEQLEENWQTEDIKKCKNKFLKNYENIKKQINKKNSQKNTITVKKMLNVIVYFNYDSYKLNSKQLDKLNKIILEATKNKEKTILINGHTDTMGSKNYNLKLSDNRANYVKEYLKSQNLTNKIITVGYGEISPLIKTGDNIIEEKNRRAEVFIK